MQHRIGITLLVDHFLHLRHLSSLHRHCLLVLLILAALFLPHAGAVEDMWTAANRIIKDVYTKIAGVSTVLAGLMSAVAVIGAKMSGTQQKADQAWDWLKRVWLAWVIINGIGAFIAYVRPLFNGLATLD